MKVTNRRGRLRIRLEPAEVALLRSLLEDLDSLLAEDDDGDPVLERLFPTAYPDDADADAEYRAITTDSLRTERRQRIAACADEVAADPELDLSDADDARRWIQVLNDLRLALGTRIGVTEDDPEVDLTDPQQQPRLVYHWLTAVQDTVVTELMG